ncbi:MAG: hypothetical protein OXF62_06595 [Caldilineaceae bacterium]|nr:hypothetical protein [Caldilineaceae bacterium]MCY4090469.1 hypothetical protein [Caldilineaceae bacterium]
MFTRSYLRRNFVIMGSVWTAVSILKDLYVPWGGGLDWWTPTAVLSGWVGCATGFAPVGGFHSSTPEGVSAQQDSVRQRNLKKMASIGGVVLIAISIGLGLFLSRHLAWLWALMLPAFCVVAIVFYWWLTWMWKRAGKDPRAGSGIP